MQLTAPDHMLGLEGLFYVSRCDHCKLLFQNPSLKQDLLQEYYPVEYPSYSLPEMQISRTALWYLKNYKGYHHLPEYPPISWLRRRFAKWTTGAQMLPECVPNGNLLEIACASGQRLDLLRKLGWRNCVGIEYSEHAAQRCRERGYKVYVGPVDDVIQLIPDESQDVIIAGSLLEHLRDPFLLTQMIASKLRTGAQFILSTIVVDSPDFALYKEFWYNLDLPRHFTFFRKRHLRQMLAKNFLIEGIYGQYSVNDYVGSARNRLKHRSRLLDRWMVSMGDKLRLGCLLLALAGKTSRICIYARKK